MLRPEKEILEIWAIYQGGSGEVPGYLVLTDQRIGFYPTRWAFRLGRDQVLWWANHNAVAHLEQWGTGIFNFIRNRLTISVRQNNYETSVYSHVVKASHGEIGRFMTSFYNLP